MVREKERIAGASGEKLHARIGLAGVRLKAHRQLTIVCGGCARNPPDGWAVRGVASKFWTGDARLCRGDDRDQSVAEFSHQDECNRHRKDQDKGANSKVGELAAFVQTLAAGAK